MVGHDRVDAGGVGVTQIHAIRPIPGSNGRRLCLSPSLRSQEGRRKMPKVLMLAGDAAESLEVTHPYQRLCEEGYDVDIAGPSRKQLQLVVHDFIQGHDTYTEKPGYSWPADLPFSEVDPADYVALVIPGGRAPEYIRNDPDVQWIIKAFFGEDKPVAPLCHAPLALAASRYASSPARGPKARRPARRVCSREQLHPRPHPPALRDQHSVGEHAQRPRRPQALLSGKYGGIATARTSCRPRRADSRQHTARTLQRNALLETA
jgi:putative intracellular protease/amidase